MEKVCKRCGKTFITNTKSQRYCSVRCRAKYWAENNRERFKIVCEYCGKEFGRIRRCNGIGGRIRFCSRTCSNNANSKYLVKERTRHKTQGYISIRKPEHPNNYGGRVREHRLIMEKMIGRYLKKGEIVHHINYIEDDNREENLFLCKEGENHYKIHKLSRFLIKEFIREKGLKEELTKYMIENCPELVKL